MNSTRLCLLTILLSCTVAAEDLVVPKPGKVITGREGCREEFICTTSSAMAPTWSKVGGNQSIEHLVNDTKLSQDGRTVWKSSLVFEALKEDNRGQITCSGDGAISLFFSLVVQPGVLVMRTNGNITLNDFTVGELVPIFCEIDTCVSDLDIVLFKDDQLVDFKTTALTQTGYNATTTLIAAKELAGRYVCQAMSEKRNLVFQDGFSITGNPRLTE